MKASESRTEGSIDTPAKKSVVIDFPRSAANTTSTAALAPLLLFTSEETGRHFDFFCFCFFDNKSTLERRHESST